MPGEQHVKFMLRIPRAMRERIAGEAEANGRSLNAEITARLGTSLDGDRRIDDLAALLDRIEATVRFVEGRTGG
jgi:hypothetical protein